MCYKECNFTCRMTSIISQFILQYILHVMKLYSCVSVTTLHTQGGNHSSPSAYFLFVRLFSVVLNFHNVYYGFRIFFFSGYHNSKSLMGLYLESRAQCEKLQFPTRLEQFELTVKYVYVHCPCTV